MFRSRRRLAANPDGPPPRTEVVLRGDGRVDLWLVARLIDRRMREMRRPEATHNRPRVTGVREHPKTYTWSWWGDEEEWLDLACRDVLADRTDVGWEVRVLGLVPQELPAPAPAPAATPEELYEEAVAEEEGDGFDVDAYSDELVNAEADDDADGEP